MKRGKSEGPADPEARASSPSRRRTPILPLAIAVICGALALASSVDARWHDALDWRRDAIASGEAWRLVTAHAMHLSASHAVLDIAALLLVAWIFGDRSAPRRQVALGFFAIAVVDGALWWLHPGVDRYVGLSGVLHAAFTAGAIGWAVTRGADRRAVATRRWGVALLIALAVKLYLESRQQAFWLAGNPFPVVTAAHRWGALAGLVGGAATAAVGWRALSRPAAAPGPAPSGAASRARRSRGR